MIVFPNCKINLGLHVTGKRADGFHELETVFYPLPITDALEVVRADELLFEASGIPIAGPVNDNLCLRAWHLLKTDFPALPPVSIHLHKYIPMGAGLGGGSADAAFMLQLLNDKFKLNIDTPRLRSYAAQLGSDCAFFINNQPSFATGRGEILTPCPVSLKGYGFLVIYPGIHVNTGWAFGQIIPQAPAFALSERILAPVNKWKDLITNDFEAPVFKAHPVLAQVKQRLYTLGAVYATMSGSGASMVGIFPEGTAIPEKKWEPAYQVFRVKGSM
ncbi:4-(cytidine 5'-diphospho)-2-C-methyl-D-erythritol kinase [Chitinophaga pendula]|uniref:4-(cytidine 5'-diphospho)-2-C-methyl-D-erythritol kinase n=1 Tax=Chitinophaga TaxID=79328 RepID=UPI000BB0A555|nr:MULTISPECIES: 4-(cytidine 5'-diphospho)-2-C-methyl-D-erythritol kinase [Chitinophaga]ASZ13052.1 4-(cytidine 5'-diphospho)-2-C-methyl-D-erythritol kinase [Chitinophaga sp. MD30]UCJ09322.1 4-(cytidine 5'-diphospho)-2-C-methyl-D-erythritol kinase [Chitinophaga pendula]